MDPRTAEEIFEPDPGANLGDATHFFMVEGFDMGETVCYTTDETEPGVSEGNCLGDTTVQLSGDTIELSCGSDKDNEVTRNVILIYAYPPDPIYPPDPVRVTADFILDCDPFSP